MANDDGGAPKADAKPSLPDFYLDPNAVLQDHTASWRHGRVPDYTQHRQYFKETKSMNHAPESLPQLVENLVKNWEIEASYKTELSDWRTVNHDRYTFAMNGGTPSTAEDMVNVGTYNAIIAPNEYYTPKEMNFTVSHRVFKRMMPTFAWEVLEVYTGPPKVAFRWRHWGKMVNDYVGFNNKGEMVTMKAHQRTISIQGVTVADLDENMKVVHLETWFDPLDMFRQMAAGGNVTTKPRSKETGAGAEGSENIASQSASASGSSSTSRMANLAARGGCPMGFAKL